MTTKLMQICPSFSPNTISNSSILLKETILQSGNCFLTDFLIFLLKNTQDSVIFMGVEYNFSHYLTISKKLGCSIENYINNSKILYIDFFNKLSDWIPSEIPLTEEVPNFWKELPKKSEIFSGFSEENFEKLFEKMSDFTKGKEKTWVFIDNLNFLLNGFDIKSSMLSFVQSIFEFLKQGLNLNLFVNVTIDDENIDISKIVQLFEMNSDILMEVSGNSSGFSKDIDGNV